MNRGEAMTIEFPITLQRRGDTVGLVIPKRIKDELGIAPDQSAMLRIRPSKSTEEWIITFRIPRVADSQPIVE